MGERGPRDIPWPLEGKFRQYRKKDGPHHVKLDGSYLEINKSDGKSTEKTCHRIETSDLVGCLLMRAGKNETRKHVSFFSIYAYPLVGTKKKQKRGREALTFEVDEHETFEKNLEVANQWRAAVMYAVRNAAVPRPRIDHTKKLLVMINPNSGPGRALQIYRKQVASVLAEAEIGHEVVVTERANHCRDLVKDMDLEKYSGCVIISGDGLLFELYNGLLDRSDWETAIQFPIGVIPGGSGNGLARSIGHWLNEPYMSDPVLVSALNLVYGRLSPMDLVMVTTPQGNRTLSFLSLGLGLLADIDIESERLRMIGESRFVVWALARWANLRRYEAEVSFKRARVNSQGVAKGRPALDRSQTVEEGSLDSQSPSLPRSNSLEPEPNSSTSGSSLDIAASLVKVEMDNGTDVQTAQEVTEGRVTDSPARSDRRNSQKSDGSGCVLTSFSEPVPSDWETVKDNFTLVYTTYQSHINSDAVLAPSATPDDGIMWLLMVSGSATKANVLQFLLKMDGNHLDIPGIELVPVEAMRVVPGSKKGFLTVDGEVIPWGPVQAYIMPKKGRLITR